MPSAVQILHKVAAMAIVAAVAAVAAIAVVAVAGESKKQHKTRALSALVKQQMKCEAAREANSNVWQEEQQGRQQK